MAKKDTTDGFPRQDQADIKCRICCQTKKGSEYHTDKNHATGLCTVCKECVSLIKQVQYRAKDMETVSQSQAYQIAVDEIRKIHGVIIPRKAF